MKKKLLDPLAAIAVFSLTFFSCTSSENATGATAMDDTTMSETQTMAGDTEVTNTDVTAAETSLNEGTADQIAYTDMFSAIENTAQYNLIDLVSTSPNLSTFISLVKQAGMEDDLKGQGEYTIFAPTNEAFAKLPQEKLDMLKDPKNKAQLMSVIMAHVLPSKVSSTQFNSSQRIKVGEDAYIPVDVNNTGTGITIGGASILKSDVEASNGVLHVVDNVIIPTTGATTDGQ